MKKYSLVTFVYPEFIQQHHRSVSFYMEVAPMVQVQAMYLVCVCFIDRLVFWQAAIEKLHVPDDIEDAL